MSQISQRLVHYCLLFCVLLFFTTWFIIKKVHTVGVLLACLSFLVLVLIGRQSRVWQSAKLIWDNRILTINPTSEKDEIVLSAFGLLNVGKIYPWGHHGLRGARLIALEIDPQKMLVSFGTHRQTTQIEFYHGIESAQQRVALEQTLWRDTGVKVVVHNWGKEETHV